MKIIASLPQVHVGAGQIASLSLTLHHGAVIAGRMKFADGSPVIDAVVGCEPIDAVARLESASSPENRGKTVSPLRAALESLSSSTHVTSRIPSTDAEGRYRIFGLLPGKYLVGTMLVIDHGSERVAMSEGSNPHPGGREQEFPEMIPVYAPSAFRRKDAKTFEIRGDEQIADADLTIDPNGLHTLRGKVLAASDRHAPGTIIQLKEEGAKEMPRSVTSGDDGTFQIDYLPSGTYTLEITASDVPVPDDSAGRQVEYKTVKLTAVVADHDVLLDDVLLVPLQTGEKNPEFSIF